MGSNVAEVREGLSVKCRVQAGKGWTATRDGEVSPPGRGQSWAGTARATPRGRAAVSAPESSRKAAGESRGRSPAPRGPQEARSSFWRGQLALVTEQWCLREGGRLSGVCVH